MTDILREQISRAIHCADKASGIDKLNAPFQVYGAMADAVLAVMQPHIDTFIADYNKVLKALKEANDESERQQAMLTKMMDHVERLPAALEERNAALRALVEMTDAAEMLWTVVANASNGDWTKQTTEWIQAAERWRDNFFRLINKNKESHE